MCEYCFLFLSCKYTTKFVQVERKASKFILKGINLLPYFVAR